MVERSKVRSWHVATVLIGAVTLIGMASPSAGASQSPPARPTITSFSVQAVTPDFDQLSGTPLALYSGGGDIEISGSAENALACTISSNKPVPGLPLTTSCTSPFTDTVTLPPNSKKKRSVTYKFTVKATGDGSAHSAPIEAQVSASPNNWIIQTVGASQYCSDYMNVTFDADGVVEDGTYSVDPGTGIVTATFPEPFYGPLALPLAWNGMFYTASVQYPTCPVTNWTMTRP